MTPNKSKPTTTQSEATQSAAKKPAAKPGLPVRSRIKAGPGGDTDTTTNHNQTLARI
jgi:hypothetical protein